MSLQATYDQTIPADTFHVAHAVFPKTNLCLWLRDEFGPLFANEQFTALFARRGNPLKAPGGWPWSRSYNFWKTSQTAKQPMLYAPRLIGNTRLACP
jgi:hypothetical protein